MLNARTLTILGLSAAALVGVVGFAAAQNRAHDHVLTVRLPGGGVEQIHYRGDIAPRVIVSAQAAPIVMASPVAAPFDWSSPFALMDQISAQSQALAREFDALSAPGAGAFAFAGPGLSEGFNFASSLAGKGVCGQSLEITSSGDGKPAQVVSRSWGDCGSKTPAKPDQAAAQAPHAAPAAPSHKLSI
jgi:hypothetical protein